MFKMFKLLIVFPHSPHWQCIQFWLSRADLSEAADRQTERRKFQYVLIISLDVVVKYGTQRKNDRKIRPRRRCRGVLCVCVCFSYPINTFFVSVGEPCNSFCCRPYHPAKFVRSWGGWTYHTLSLGITWRNKKRCKNQLRQVVVSRLVDTPVKANGEKILSQPLPPNSCKTDFCSCRH